MDPYKVNANQGHDTNIVDLNISDSDDDSSIEVIFVKTPRHLRLLRSASPETLSSDDSQHDMPDTIDLVSVSKETIDVMDSSDDDTADFLQPTSSPPNVVISRLQKTSVVSRKTLAKSTVHGAPAGIAVKRNFHSLPKPINRPLSNLTTETSLGDNDDDNDSCLLTPSPKKSRSSQGTDTTTSSRAASNSHVKSDTLPTRVLCSEASTAEKLSATRSLRTRSPNISSERRSSLRSLKSDALSSIEVSTSKKEICFDAPTPPLKSDVATSSKSDDDDLTEDEDLVEPSTNKGSIASRDLFNHRANETNRKRGALDKLRAQRASKRRKLYGKDRSAAKRTLRPRNAKVDYQDPEQADIDFGVKLDRKQPAKVTNSAKVTNTKINAESMKDSSSKQDESVSPTFEAESSNIDDSNGLITETNEDDNDRTPEQMFVRNWEQLQEPVIWKFKRPALSNSSLGEHRKLSQTGFEWSRENATVRTKVIDSRVMVCGGESRFYAPRYRRLKYLDLVQWIPMRSSNQPIDKSETSLRPTYCSVYTYHDDNAKSRHS
jgi:hypothetical protein